jgi:rare lipoprotein A (peptidoglycan hydrolase)
MKIFIASLALVGVFALASSPGAEGQRYEAQVTRIKPVHVKHSQPRARLARATRSNVRRSYGTSQFGRASWYTGNLGACGRTLTGYYAASRTLPCGAHVLVSYGGRSVIVTILDRGPNSSRLALDLSRSAFAALAPLSEGVIDISWRLAR